jgi:hypothetical protein
MNTNLLNALKEIVSEHGGVETLSDARRVKAFLADLAAAEPKPQKNALISCIEHGFPAMLQNLVESERGHAKAKLAERLNREEGLDSTLCANTLDILEAAIFGWGGGGDEFREKVRLRRQKVLPCLRHGVTRGVAVLPRLRRGGNHIPKYLLPKR